MEHIEDMILNDGVNGARLALKYILEYRSMLAGRSTQKHNLSVKWDEAPSIFAGIDPADGKFFVAKKGIFNVKPKLYKSDAEIDAELTGDLGEKFKIALRHFPSLGITGVLQGDFLFTRSDLKQVTFDGVAHITFHPNTIVYAVPVNTKMADAIMAAEIGVVWHTSYEGKSLATMKATFNADIVSSLRKSRKVWYTDARYGDMSGAITLTSTEDAKLLELMQEAGKVLHQVNPTSLKNLHSHPDLLIRVKTHMNSMIRKGFGFSEKNMFQGIIKDIDSYYDKEAAKLKTLASKGKMMAKKHQAINVVLHISEEQFAHITKFMDLIIKAKMIIIEKLNTIKSVHTFLRTSQGYEVTGYEGFVASDHLGKNAVKLVDRLTFSKANFDPSYIKGWQR